MYDFSHPDNISASLVSSASSRYDSKFMAGGVCSTAGQEFFVCRSLKPEVLRSKV